MDDQNKSIPFDRKLMIDILVYHWRTNNSGCGCGWAELARSHPEHVVEVYEMSIIGR